MSQMSGASADIRRIAVVSDLHAYETASASGPTPSYLTVGNPGIGGAASPINELCNLIVRERQAADLLLCPGDLGDKANPTAIKYAWDAIGRLGSQLNVSDIFCTPGNHDIDSRRQFNSFEANECLRRLEKYPCASPNVRTKFWSDHFAIVDRDEIRILLLDSCAHHGGAEIEKNHGRISGYTLELIAAELSASDRRPLQILLCHHHPHSHAEHQLGAVDVMESGQLLLDLLSKHGQWFVLHGHKHHPKISYAAGGNSGPCVFAAGSLCASPNPWLSGHARNQYYLLEFDMAGLRRGQWCGAGRAWDWDPAGNWNPAGSDSGLPHVFGFGFRGNITGLAFRVQEEVVSKGLSKWSDLTNNIAELRYLLPQDISELRQVLNRSYNLNIVFENGAPRQVGAP